MSTEEQGQNLIIQVEDREMEGSEEAGASKHMSTKAHLQMCFSLSLKKLKSGVSDFFSLLTDIWRVKFMSMRDILEKEGLPHNTRASVHSSARTLLL